MALEPMRFRSLHSEKRLDHLADSRYGVYSSIMLDQNRDLDAIFKEPYDLVRYAFQIYNTFPAEMEECVEVPGDSFCQGKKEIDNELKDLRLKILAPSFDASKLSAYEQLMVRLLEAGMIDKADQPASVKLPRYPPPLVPNWSEYFERDRYIEETNH